MNLAEKDKDLKPDDTRVKRVPQTYLNYTANYASRDGENCPEKAGRTAIVGAGLGALVGVYDVAQLSHLTGAMAISIRMANWVLPFAGMGVAYSAVTCLSGQVRGKDGPLNHAIGGFTAGMVWGLHRRHWLSAVYGGLVFITLCPALKAWKDLDLPVAPMHIQREHGMLGHHKRHFGFWRKELTAPKEY